MGEVRLSGVTAHKLRDLNCENELLDASAELPAADCWTGTGGSAGQRDSVSAILQHRPGPCSLVAEGGSSRESSAACPEQLGARSIPSQQARLAAESQGLLCSRFLRAARCIAPDGGRACNVRSSPKQWPTRRLLPRSRTTTRRMPGPGLTMRCGAAVQRRPTTVPSFSGHARDFRLVCESSEVPPVGSFRCPCLEACRCCERAAVHYVGFAPLSLPACCERSGALSTSSSLIRNVFRT